MEILILAGGLSHERDVSVRSGRRVQEALRDGGHDVVVRDVDTELIPTLQEHPGRVVWPLLHGSSGEDGSIQGLLELLGVPYVGTAAKAARAAWVKPIAKSIYSRSGIATPDYVTLPQSLFREVGAEKVLDAVVERFGLPLVVKPARGGSALGVSIVTERAELPRAMVHCFAYGDTALIERAIEGTEVAVSVVGSGDDARALIPVEISCEGAYDYDARYNPGRVEYFAPARLAPEKLSAVADAAVAVHRVLGLKDLSRIDTIVDADGTPYVLDVNVAPGMTETSLFPQAAEAAGFSLSALYGEIAAGAATSA